MLAPGSSILHAIKGLLLWVEGKRTANFQASDVNLQFR
jgi:hypothetical protein